VYSRLYTIGGKYFALSAWRIFIFFGEGARIFASYQPAYRWELIHVIPCTLPGNSYDEKEANAMKCLSGGVDSSLNISMFCVPGKH
jgi:hypothetical protein